MSLFERVRPVDVVQSGPCHVAIERHDATQAGFNALECEFQANPHSDSTLPWWARVSNTYRLVLWLLTVQVVMALVVPFVGAGTLIVLVVSILLPTTIGAWIRHASRSLHQAAALAAFGLAASYYAILLLPMYEYRSRDTLRIRATHSVLLAILDSWVFRAFVLGVGFASGTCARVDCLAMLFGVDVHQVPLRRGRAYLVNGRGGVSIYVSDALDIGERTEVILHELAHFLLRHVLAAPLDLVWRRVVASELTGDHQEREADAVARAVVNEELSQRAVHALGQSSRII